MANENRMQKWLDIVDRDIDVAEWLQIATSTLVRMQNTHALSGLA